MNFTTGMGNSPMQSMPSHNHAFTLCHAFTQLHNTAGFLFAYQSILSLTK